MRFEDERYIRVYTRDTLTWLRLEWQGQAVLSLLFRKVDRAGILAIDDEDPVEALATVLRMPVDVVATGWEKLTSGKDPVVTLRDDPSRAIFIPNFLPAQEANQSDPARKRKSREMAAARTLVTSRDGSSRSVTESHTRSHAVTPSSALPSCTESTKAKEVASPSAQPVASIGEQQPLLPKAVSAVEDVFEFWRVAMGKNARTELAGDREKAIRKRLASGRTVDEIKRAVRGCRSNPWNMGANDRSRRYDDIELICRDPTNFEAFLADSEKPPCPLGPNGLATGGLLATNGNGQRKPFVPLTGTTERFKGYDDSAGLQALGLKFEPKKEEPPRG